MPFSKMQNDFFMNATHRWNIKTGATRSGKTYMDYFVIPKRIRKCTGKGHIVILGNTRPTAIRNVIEPMRNIWGERFVPNVRADGSIMLFGKKAYIFPAGTKSDVERLQGMSIEYCYGDEVTTWNEAVFAMLKSRLDRPNSCFDGTCNPDNPSHWFKAFLESDADIYQQAYTIDDNPFNDAKFVSELKKEYLGTVYYDRFILGRWVAAEGIIYRKFADDPDSFVISYDKYKELLADNGVEEINIGVDFGGTGSGTSFVTTVILGDYAGIIVLASRRIVFELTPDTLGRYFVEFVRYVEDTYDVTCDNAMCDSAEQILIRGIREAADTAGLNCRVKNARKDSIKDRIRLTNALLGRGTLYLTTDNETLSNALSKALWRENSIEDIRLDDGTTDIDTLDAYEYTIETHLKDFIQV